MTIRLVGRVLGAAALCAGVIGCERTGDASATPVSDKRTVSVESKVERGRYLADHVAMCTDCHTPRYETGTFVQERWLGGAPLGFAPTVPMPAWAVVAPPIAGRATLSEAHIVTLLTTGARPDGSLCRPPMPHYRMSVEDAEAVVAYLRSINYAGGTGGGSP